MRTLLYVQGVIEIVGGILLLIGAYTRVVAFILAGDMAVAYFIAQHGGAAGPLPRGARNGCAEGQIPEACRPAQPRGETA